MASIKILKEGPYLVSGDIKLYSGIIGKGEDGVLDLLEVEEIQLSDSIREEGYALCRCGSSENAPFCDGSHIKIEFDGTTTASKEKYLDRVDTLEGKGVNLLDDHRCARARFCHRKNGSVWELVENSDTEENKKEAIEGAFICPAGRLTTQDKETLKLDDPEYKEPKVIIVEDPLKEVSSSIYLQGYIEITDENGEIYEVQNRRALCRCGESKNKPFCDGEHIPIKYQAKK